MTERDDDPYWEYDESECWNCGGEGFVYGCSWDWQCDTYDEGEGTCLCARRCHVCNAAKRDPELQRVLADALRDSGSGPQGENSRSEVEGEAPQSGDAEGGNRPTSSSTPSPQEPIK